MLDIWLCLEEVCPYRTPRWLVIERAATASEIGAKVIGLLPIRRLISPDLDKAPAAGVRGHSRVTHECIRSCASVATFAKVVSELESDPVRESLAFAQKDPRSEKGMVRLLVSSDDR